MKSKLYVFFFFTILFLFVFSIAVAADNACGEDVSWTFEPTNGILTISGNGEMNEYFGEEDVPWHTVRSQIRVVYISDGITTICNDAFSGCVNLSSMNTVVEGNFYLPEELLSVGNKAFYECTKMRQIVIGNHLKTVGAYAFSGCNRLINIYFPDSLEAIGEGAFYSCHALAKVHLGWSTISEIPEKAFYECRRLGDLIYPKTLKKLGAYSFSYSNISSFLALELESIEEIGEYAFEYSIGGAILLPSSIKKVGLGAFANSRIYDMNWHLDYIPEDAFKNCSNLHLLFFYNSLNVIGNHAFEGCHEIDQIYYPRSQEEFDKIEGIHSNSNAVLFDADIQYEYQYIPSQEHISSEPTDRNTDTEQTTVAQNSPIKLLNIIYVLVGLNIIFLTLILVKPRKSKRSSI